MRAERGSRGDDHPTAASLLRDLAIDRSGFTGVPAHAEVNVRTVRFLLVGALLAAGCSQEGRTTGKITELRVVQPQVTEPQVATSVAAIATDVVALQEDSPGLVDQAKVTDANARVIALQRVPGGRIVEAELEVDDGRLLYEYEIRVADRPGIVKSEIDARNGAVVREKRRDQAGGR
jgi:uncharacterized membrane protein YkoI